MGDAIDDEVLTFAVVSEDPDELAKEIIRYGIKAKELHPFSILGNLN